jgi:hypothetical protein
MGSIEAHVIPVDDLIEHKADENCICDPTCEPAKRKDGTFGWVYIHHPLSPEIKTIPNS